MLEERQPDPIIDGIEEMRRHLEQSTKENDRLCTENSALRAGKNPPHPYLGKPVIIRTVTYHYTGRIVHEDGRYLHLEEAAWIADSGLWAEALTAGTLSEVEPYPDGVCIALEAIVDVSPWDHPLPRSRS